MERIFRDKMAELYWLAFLLTGDRERSVQAYTAALNSEAPAPALQKFMLAWARKLVIVAALGTLRHQLRESMLRTRAAHPGELKSLGHLAPVDLENFTKAELEEVLLAMDLFQRCAVILTVLERMPVHDAAALLGAEESTVKAAQARGVEEMVWRMAGLTQSESPRFFGFDGASMAAFG